MTLAVLPMLIALVYSTPGFAAKIGIVTDQPNAAMARALEALIRQSFCFKDLASLKIEIKTVDSSALQCRPNEEHPELLDCDDAYAKFASEMNADKVILIKDQAQRFANATLGGMGGVITTAMPHQSGLHELCHTLGFLDEYQFDANAARRCRQGRSGPNLAMFRDLPPYKSDAQARERHADEIPWYDHITAKLITTGPNLGTPEPSQIGLYHSKVCDKASNGVKAWRPGNLPFPTVMESSEVALIPPSFCPAIWQALGGNPTAGGEGGATQNKTPDSNVVH